MDLHVSAPWAWWWATRDDRLVTVDPDVEDCREPRHPDTGLDWARVAQAVRAAVAQVEWCPEDGMVDFATVSVDVPLTDAEREVAAGWLGDGSTAVCADLYPEQLLWDGRHRLWAAGQADPGP